jgi:hypothetical protein
MKLSLAALALVLCLSQGEAHKLVQKGKESGIFSKMIEMEQEKSSFEQEEKDKVARKKQ